MTFDASINPIAYEDGEAVFIDTEPDTWNMRLTRGWEYFGYMNPFLRIIGCGFGHLADYFDISGMGMKMSNSINLTSYMNSFTGV